MQLHDLQVFCQLYEQGSINRVASLMGFTQSNISARLQALEAEFGVPLFVRSYRGIAPTANGTIVYDYAKRVLAATDAVHRALMPRQTKRRVVMSELLFNWLVGASDAYALADADYAVMNSTAIAALPAHAADEVVTYANFHNAAYVQAASGVLPASFLIRADVAAAGLPFVVNADTQCPFRRRTLRYLRQTHASVQVVDSWAGIRALVQAGKAIALLPDYLLTEALRRFDARHRFRVPYGTFRAQ